MSKLHLDSAVGQWVAEIPATSRVFESLQIDYCCGGKKPLTQACSDRQLNPQDVLKQLQQASSEADRQPVAESWVDAPLAALCDHIEQTHHAYLKTELPRLAGLVAKVVSAHGSKHPELAEVQRALAELQGELVPHMFKEEHILFPSIRRLEQSDGPLAFPFGTIANPIHRMEYEHKDAGNALEQIRTLTRDYCVPDGACNTYRAMLDGLHTLELDMHQHVHKENSILFPRAIELELLRSSA
jgi:regulator of cell morphogenesis and NO signaling